METAREHLSDQQIDGIILFGSLLLRGAGYAVVAAIADHYDFGKALCLGLLVGDIAATVGGLALRLRDGIVHTLAELATLLLVSWCLGCWLSWPHDPAMRAILALAAFGVFVSRTGGNMLTRLGPE